LPPVTIEDIVFNNNKMMNPNKDKKIPCRRGVSGLAGGFEKMHKRDLAWMQFWHQYHLWLITGRHGPPPIPPPKEPNKLGLK
jgi:hypothetical protein